MDIQLKRGFIEVCVLASMVKGDSYGYKLIKDVAPVIEISESTLYPILRRLENNGCVTVYSCEHNGRLRKYYSITQTGKEKLSEFLKDWSEISSIYNFIKGECKND